jgi:DNA polymerase V
MLKNSSNPQQRGWLEIAKPDLSHSKKVGASMAVESVHAGFPSPAEDFMEETLDINKLLVKHPSSTFYVRVKGDSMKDASIFEGDILVVDKAEEPSHNCIAVCFLDGEFTLKRVNIDGGSPTEKSTSTAGTSDKKILLMPANKSYKPIEVTADNQFLIWGIVRYIIHKL